MAGGQPQQVLLSYVMPNGSFDNIFLDASVNEQHITMAQITEHQVESGANVTDYIRPMPLKVTIEGIATNTPLATPQSQARGAIGQVQASQALVPMGMFQPQLQVNWQSLQFTGGTMDRVRDVYGGLVTAALAGALFQITTTLTNYTNMAVANFAVPRSADKANALHFTIDFQQIRIVTTQTVAALPSSVQQTTRGPKAAATASTQQQGTASVAYNAINSLTGLLSGH